MVVALVVVVVVVTVVIVLAATIVVDAVVVEIVVESIATMAKDVKKTFSLYLCENSLMCSYDCVKFYSASLSFQRFQLILKK